MAQVLYIEMSVVVRSQKQEAKYINILIDVISYYHIDIICLK